MAADSGFLGTGWAFPPGFDRRGRSALTVAREQDIEQSLRILLGTEPGERVMQPSFGCGLRRLVHEPVHEGTLTSIRSLVEQAVLFFEARITLERVDFDLARVAEGVLGVVLVYTVRTTNARHNLVYPMYLREASALDFEA